MTVDKLLILVTKTSISFIVFIIFSFTVPVFQEVKASLNFDLTHRVVIGDAVLIVDIVNTSQKRRVELSDPKILPDGTGVFFIFENLDFHGIWMKDMDFDIDIIWFDKTKKVVFIEEKISSATSPKVFTPDKKSLYVLEVPAGFVKKNGIQIRDQLTQL